MNDLIERKEVIKILEKAVIEVIELNRVNSCNSGSGKEKWIGKSLYLKCSGCGFMFSPAATGEMYNYCPNCGADMLGEYKYIPYYTEVNGMINCPSFELDDSKEEEKGDVAFDDGDSHDNTCCYSKHTTEQKKNGDGDRCHFRSLGRSENR